MLAFDNMDFALIVLWLHVRALVVVHVRIDHALVVMSLHGYPALSSYVNSSIPVPCIHSLVNMPCVHKRRSTYVSCHASPSSHTDSTPVCNLDIHALVIHAPVS